MVEDNPADAELLLRELRRNGFDPQWKRVETEPDFLAGIAELPDIVLSDYSMPAFNGLRAAELLRESDLNIPFILISGTVGEEVAVEAMRHGATDYLLKDRTARLGASVEQALEQKALREERKKADREIRAQLHELQRWHEAMLGREERILELKSEVNELLAQIGQPQRYTTPPMP
jgi:DNA-binding NtrC family response regulator